MLTEDDVQRLRDLVDAGPAAPPPEARDVDWPRMLRIGGIALAVAIVLGSIFVAISMLLAELSDDDDQLSTRPSADPDQAVPVVVPTADTSSPAATADPSPSSDEPVNSFGELRYLPSGTLGEIELTSIVRIESATPIAAFTHTRSSGVLDGVVLVDVVSEPWVVDGLGVAGLEAIDVNGIPAQIAPTGRGDSYVVRWEDPVAGTLHAWGYGTTASELNDVVNELAPGLLDATALDQETEWSRVAGYGSTEARPVWRALYADPAGEIAIVATAAEASASPVLNTSQCVSDTSGRSECGSTLTWVDDDDVEITLLAGEDRRGQLGDRLRPTTENNARVRATEIAPYTEVPFDQAPQLLYLPEPDSGWDLVGALAHSSGRVVSTPALVLVERDIPQIGDIVGAIVVTVLPAGSEEPGAVVEGGDRINLVVEESGLLLELVGWRQSAEELASLSRAITITPQGLEYASAALRALGIERSYEIAFLNPSPGSAVEGTVFAARFINELGDEITHRVSFVPGFIPEAAAAKPHQNDVITRTIRGRTASFVVSQQLTTVEWQESPGIVISVTGTSDTAVLQFAESLERSRAEALSQPA